MTRLTVHVGDRKSEKLLLAVLHALELDYELDSDKRTVAENELKEPEVRMYNRLKSSFEEIRKYKRDS